MLQHTLKQRRQEEEGFTLIELMVVVLIIGILVAIALPTFLGARERAQDKAAESSIRNALAAGKTIFTDNDDYSGVSATELDATEPSLTYCPNGGAPVCAGTDSIAPTGIAWEVPAAGTNTAFDTLNLAAASDSGKCFMLHDVSVDGGAQQAGTYYNSTVTSTNCSGADADTATASKW